MIVAIMAALALATWAQAHEINAIAGSSSIPNHEKRSTGRAALEKYDIFEKRPE
jgi:hypothetical protein